jgi:hypothetical protein
LSPPLHAPPTPSKSTKTQLYIPPPPHAVPLANGTLTAADAGPIFLADGDAAGSFAGEMRVVASAVGEPALRLMATLGALPLSPTHVVDAHIVPLFKAHHEGGARTLSPEAVVAYMSYVRDNVHRIPADCIAAVAEFGCVLTDRGVVRRLKGSAVHCFLPSDPGAPACAAGCDLRTLFPELEWETIGADHLGTSPARSAEFFAAIGAWRFLAVTACDEGGWESREFDAVVAELRRRKRVDALAAAASVLRALDSLWEASYSRYASSQDGRHPSAFLRSLREARWLPPSDVTRPEQGLCTAAEMVQAGSPLAAMFGSTVARLSGAVSPALVEALGVRSEPTPDFVLDALAAWSERDGSGDEPTVAPMRGLYDYLFEAAMEGCRRVAEDFAQRALIFVPSPTQAGRRFFGVREVCWRDPSHVVASWGVPVLAMHYGSAVASRHKGERDGRSADRGAGLHKFFAYLGVAEIPSAHCYASVLEKVARGKDVAEGFNICCKIFAMWSDALTSGEMGPSQVGLGWVGGGGSFALFLSISDGLSLFLSLLG